SRILSQPIYRDALLAGKFLGALTTIAISLLWLWLLVGGVGMKMLGGPPGGGGGGRAPAVLGIPPAPSRRWCVPLKLPSVCATPVLAALGIWLFLTLLWPMVVPGIAGTIAPPDPRYAMFGLQDPVTVQWAEVLRRISPNDLFNGASLALLAPDTRQTSQIVNLSQWQGAVLGAPLPLTESLAIAWPQAVALIAGVIVL